jgi:tRNA nucleotidyltransferase/poly(A) polymerase
MIKLNDYEESLFSLINTFSESSLVRTHLCHVLNFIQFENENSYEYLKDFYSVDALLELNNCTREITRISLREILLVEYNFDILSENISNKYCIVFRVAGGWVRDKLLGINSDDIDFTVDVMKGITVATLLSIFVKEYKITNQTENYQIDNKYSIKLGEYKVAAIKADEEVNKLIAPAKVFNSFLERELDFVNLRGEEYTDTRRPIIKFGCPQIDAERRDSTVNSLFYNVNNREVEDLTGRGLTDLLINKIIDTPLDPLITFEDDPLRIFRTLRFSSRLNYDIHPRILKLLMYPPSSLTYSLQTKVKKERFAQEIIKIYDLDGRYRAYRYLLSFPLFKGLLYNLRNPSTLNETERIIEYFKFFFKEDLNQKIKTRTEDVQLIYQSANSRLKKLDVSIHKTIFDEISSIINCEDFGDQLLLLLPKIRECFVENNIVDINFELVAYYATLLSTIIFTTNLKELDNNIIEKIVYYIVYFNCPINSNYSKYVYLIIMLIKRIKETIANNVVESILFNFDALFIETRLTDTSPKIKLCLWIAAVNIAISVGIDTSIFKDDEVNTILMIWSALMDKYDTLNGEKAIKSDYIKKLMQKLGKDSNILLTDRNILVRKFRYFIFKIIYDRVNYSWNEFNSIYLKDHKKLNFDGEIDRWIDMYLH